MARRTARKASVRVSSAARSTSGGSAVPLETRHGTARVGPVAGALEPQREEVDHRRAALLEDHRAPRLDGEPRRRRTGYDARPARAGHDERHPATGADGPGRSGAVVLHPAPQFEPAGTLLRAFADHAGGRVEVGRAAGDEVEVAGGGRGLTEIPGEQGVAVADTIPGHGARRQRPTLRLRLDRGQVRAGELPGHHQGDRADAAAEVERAVDDQAGAPDSLAGVPCHEQVVGAVTMAAAQLEDAPGTAQGVERLVGPRFETRGGGGRGAGGMEPGLKAGAACFGVSHPAMMPKVRPTRPGLRTTGDEIDV
jgi:hypothetical protein